MGGALKITDEQIKAQQKAIDEAYEKAEPLHEDLQNSIITTTSGMKMIHHRLYVAHYMNHPMLIETANKVYKAKKELEKKGLNEYLGKQFLQYFEYPEASNLTTNGGELITPTGKDYVGAYHIHKNQGPMEGATHIQGAHRKLFYKRFYQSELVDTLNQTGVIETGETQRIEFVNDLTVEYDAPNQTQTSNNNSSTGGGY